MQVKQYQNLYRWFTARPRALAVFAFFYRYTTVVVVVAYLALLALQGYGFVTVFAAGGGVFAAAQGLGVALGLPAVIYLSGTWLRAALNYPRPYEQPGFTPLIVKDKQGHACPSRHVLSVSVIAVAWCPTNVYVALALGVCALCIAALRVIAGVHSIRDVVAGLAFGGGVGALVLWLMTQLFWAMG